MSKLASASLVVLGHVFAIVAFANVGPSLIDAVSGPPLQIMLLPAANAAVEPPPPLVRLEVPQVELEPPIVPLIELADDAPSNSAITLASERTTPPPPATVAVPALVSDVEYLDPPRPGYPSASRRMHEQGLVVLRVLVDEHGRAELLHVHQSSGHARLDQAAVEAVQRAEFKPYVANGLVQRVYVLVPIEFALNRSPNPHG